MRKLLLLLFFASCSTVQPAKYIEPLPDITASDKLIKAVLDTPLDDSRWKFKMELYLYGRHYATFKLHPFTLYADGSLYIGSWAIDMSERQRKELRYRFLNLYSRCRDRIEEEKERVLNIKEEHIWIICLTSVECSKIIGGLEE